VIDHAGNRAAWVELQPFTGRTHQLRVHMAAIGHPIVGDGKYGGQDAFLTGSISRKMHLHARRLRIEHPDGDHIDVTAPLPEHFAASMIQLGFDEAMGETDFTPPTPDPAAKKQAAKAYAKTYRKERRGERRGRGEGDAAPARTAARRTGASKPASGGKPKPGGKPRSEGKPRLGDKTPRGRSGPGKTSGPPLKGPR
jgi:23S rRNA pseudouridine955/2504/2580 synthase